MAAGGLIRVWKSPLRAPAGPIAPLRGARGPPARPFFLRLSAPAVQPPPAPCARRLHCTPAGSARPTRPALSLRLSAPAVQALPLRAPAGPIAPLRGARGPPARPFPLRLSAAAVQAPPAPCAICIDWLIHIWISRKSFVSLPLQRRAIVAAVALLLFTKPAVGVFGGGMVKTKSDLVFSTKHLVETTRHLVSRRC